jgi:hypothetical protein
MDDFTQSLLVTRLRERGPKLSEKEVEQFEREIGARLPEDYRWFLLTFNGGCYYEEYIIEFDTPGGPVGSAIAGFSFCSLNVVDSASGGDLRWLRETHDGRVPDGMIPIGNAGTDLILLDTACGSGLYLWVRDREMRVEHPNDNRFFLAQSFSDFANECHYLAIDEQEAEALEIDEPFRSIDLRRHDLLEQYLDDGFALFETNDRGQTLLYVACRELNYEAAMLLDRGADPDDGDRNAGRPPLYAAAAPGAGELVQLLLSHGASLYMDNTQSRTILESLPWPPNPKIKRLLLV